jgi:hypothetical protein
MPLVPLRVCEPPRRAAGSVYGWTGLYPVFVRGEAYLAERNGIAAAAKFQKILDHTGIVLMEPIGALAHLPKKLQVIDVATHQLGPFGVPKTCY